MDKAVGIDLGGTFIKFGLVKRDGSILKQDRKESGGEKGRGEVLFRMEEAIHEAISGTRLSEIKGIGIETPGLVNVFNPEAIIIGGGVAQAGEPLFSAIKEEIIKRSFPLLSKNIKILPVSLNQESGIKAATALIF